MARSGVSTVPIFFFMVLPSLRCWLLCCAWCCRGDIIPITRPELRAALHALLAIVTVDHAAPLAAHTTLLRRHGHPSCCASNAKTVSVMPSADFLPHVV